MRPLFLVNLGLAWCCCALAEDFIRISPADDPGPRYTFYRDSRDASRIGAGQNNDREQVHVVVAGELLVRFRTGVGRAKQESILKPLGVKMRFLSGQGAENLQLQNQAGQKKRSLLFDHLALVTLDPKVDLATAIAQFQQRPEVLYVEPNYRVQAAENSSPPGLPNDFDFAQQWGMHNTGQSGGTPGADIHVLEAWQLSTGDQGIIVAVIDTGVDYYHPDLADNLWINPKEIPGNGIDDDGNGFVDDVHGYDFVSLDGDPMDDNFHGTHVAGIVGARGNNKVGVAGLCWKVGLMALKALDETGNGDVDKAIEAIQYAIQNGARVINASWGLEEKSRALEEAVQEAQAAGILFVAAAGNSRSDAVFYPAAYQDVVSVAATDSLDHRAYFSNYGSHASVAAPGDNIYSTFPNNRYEFLSGTSMAAPHVSGLAALILARHPRLTNLEVNNILRNTTDPISSDQYIGTGRINAYRALQVESPLPVAKLNLPGTIEGTIPIRGTAKGKEFARYSLEYGAGNNPTNWTGFYSSDVPVDEGTLSDDFYTPRLEEGRYTFRLTAQNSNGQAAVERAEVNVQNVAVTFPLNNDVLRRGQSLAIRGTVFGQGRTYTIDYALGGPRDKVWSNAGIRLAGAGANEVIDGTLAIWDTSSIRTNEFYTLRLTARKPGKPAEEFFVYMVHFGDQLKPGWPQYLPITGEYQKDDWRNITVADLDHDGFKEIVLVDQGNAEAKASWLLVYNYDGQLRWARELGHGFPYFDTPVIGDIDGDGFMEILVESGGKLFAFRHDGTPLAGNWPVTLESPDLGKVLADLDGDGNLELIGYSQGTLDELDNLTRQLVVFDQRGNLLRKWVVAGCPTPIDAPKMFPAVGNLDDNPDLEIIAVSGCHSLSVYNLKKIEPLWTATTDGSLVASPVVGDINHDGKNEVIIGAFDFLGGSQGGLYAFNNKGQILSGWPVLVEESFAVAPALADFNGDGFLEISIPGWRSEKLHLVHHYGFEAEGWPVGPLSQAKLKTSTIIGDIDGDGIPDVVFAAPGHLYETADESWSSLGGVMALGFDGKLIPLNHNDAFFPLIIESPALGPSFRAAPVTLTDLDNNGRLDVIAASIQDVAFASDAWYDKPKNRSSIYVWEMNVPYRPAYMPWPEFQGNPQHTGRFQFPPHVNAPPVVSRIPNQTIKVGSAFFPIELDRYVEDRDHQPSEMTWTVAGNNQLQVVIDNQRVARILPPNSAWAGQETIQFIATDPGGLQSSAAAVFAAKTDYNPPIVRDDRAKTMEDTPVDIDVLANDTSPTGDVLSILEVERPRFGKARVTGNGGLQYTPQTDFNGEDTFHYIVDDGKGGLAIGLVAVQVLPVDDPPLAVLDRVITWEDEPVAIDVLANDVDPDGDPIALASFDQPENGTVVKDQQGLLIFSPKTNFSGPAQFTYRITDGHGTESTGTVELLVKSANDRPVAENKILTFNRNLSQDVFFPNQDVDGDHLKFSLVTSPKNGDVFVYPTILTYYPQKGFAGTDSLTYRLNDGYENSELATVTFIVVDANNPPVPQSQSVVTKRGQPLPITLAATDADDDPITYEVTGQPAHGSVTGAPPDVIYQPQPDYLGADKFEFQASDGQSTSRVASIEIKVTDLNTAPVARNSSFDTKINTPTNIVLQASDGEGNPLTYQILSVPAHGKLTGAGPGFLYEPATDYIGFDRFRFKVNDGEFDSNEATVTISVRSRNTAPQIKDQYLTVDEGRATAIDLAVTDPDGDPLASAILKGPRYGLLSGRGTNLTYTPKVNFAGIDSFTYKVWDGQTYSVDGKVSITVWSPTPEIRLVFETIQSQANGQVRLTLKNAPDRQIEIFGSTDLVEWVSLFKTSVDTGTFSFVDIDAPKFQRRFYRAVQY